MIIKYIYSLFGFMINVDVLIFVEFFFWLRNFLKNENFLYICDFSVNKNVYIKNLYFY